MQKEFFFLPTCFNPLYKTIHRPLSGVSVIGGTHTYTLTRTYTHTHIFSPFWSKQRKMYWTGKVCVWYFLKAETRVSHQMVEVCESCFMYAGLPYVQVERAVALRCDLRGAGSPACPKTAPATPEFRHSVRKTLVQMK